MNAKEYGTEKARVEVPASEVKNAWHDYVDRVSRLRETIIVTRYGRPVMQLTPIEESDTTSVIGFLAGTVTIHGDIVAPLDEEWEASA